MVSCKNCIAYTEKFSTLCEENQDSVPTNEKPKEHFCFVFTAGIPDEYWSDEKRCPYFIGRESK